MRDQPIRPIRNHSATVVFPLRSRHPDSPSFERWKRNSLPSAELLQITLRTAFTALPFPGIDVHRKRTVVVVVKGAHGPRVDASVSQLEFLDVLAEKDCVFPTARLTKVNFARYIYRLARFRFHSLIFCRLFRNSAIFEPNILSLMNKRCSTWSPAECP